jgi:hypothetical protein
MAPERIVATVMPGYGYRSQDQRMPAAGQMLDVAIQQAAGDDLLVTLAQGMSLHLKGLGYLAAQLKPGDTMAMRVLATEPHLTLALVDALPAADPHAPSSAMELRAMQFDQLALGRMSMPAPNASTLAAGWRMQVFAALQAHGVLSEAAPGTQGLQIAAAERWMFPAFAWTGMPVLLRLAEADEDDAGARKRRRREAALWTEFELPGIGRLAVRVQLADDGISLLLAVEREAALPHVRSALPAIARALAAARLRVRRCQLGLGWPDAHTMRAWTAEWPQTLETALPAALFRAASEALLALAFAPPAAKIIIPGNR